MPFTPWALPRTVTGTGWTASDAGTLLNAVTINELTIYATHNAPVTDPLFCTNFDFGLTGTEVIEGLEINIVARFDAAIIAPTVGGILVKGTADAVTLLGTGSNCYPLSTTFTSFTLGGPTDTLGYAWAGIDVGGNTSFGFGIQSSTDPSYVESPTRKRWIDYVRARVYYSAGGTGGGASSVLAGRFVRVPNFGNQVTDSRSRARKN